VRRSELTRQLADLLGVGASHEARFIVEDVVGPAGDPSDAEAAHAHQLAARRLAGEPLQYVLGHWAFRSLDLLVDPRVLIPRPETEHVVEVARRELVALGEQDPFVVDAGTGSGAIALSLATELPVLGLGGRVLATDASIDALALARANLERVRGAAGAILPVEFFEGDWLEPLPPSVRGAVTLVVSNPPYVATSEWDELPEEVRAEPRRALVAADGREGTPGLADVEALLLESPKWLAQPGVVVLELAPAQAGPARLLACSLGYDESEVERDLAGRERVLVARLR
jgi:release factor glutamine methyltransferase